MTRHASTLEDLSDLIHRLYEAALVPEMWSKALEALGDGLGGCALGMTVQSFRGPARRLALARLDPNCMAVMFRNYPDARTNPMVAVMSSLPAAVAMARQAVKSDSDYFTSGLYNDVFRPQGLAHAAVVCAFRSRDNFVPLGIFRRANQGDLGKRDFDLLKLVLPHLRRALQIYLRLGCLDSQQEVVGSALDKLPFGLIFFDSAGRVWKLNQPAELIIAEGDGLAIRNGVLEASSAAETRILQSLIHSAVGIATGGSIAAGGGVIAISRPSMALPFSLLVAPLSDSGTNLGTNGPGAVAFIADPARGISSPGDTLIELFGLTATEARVAGLLVAGLAIEEVAGQMGIEPSTVRAHLKRIFGKTDTNRQADLVRIVLNSVAAVGRSEKRA